MDRSDALRIYQAARGLLERGTEQSDARVNLVRSLFANYGPRRAGAHVPEQGARWAPPTDFADKAYENGLLRPVSYAYLALIIELLRLEADETFVHLKQWGYVLYFTLSDSDREQFVSLARRGGLLSAEMEEQADIEPADRLRELATTMLRYALLHYSYEELRKLLRWLHEAYRPYLERLLAESTNNEAWLVNIAELVPRLLLKNLVPMDDCVTSEAPTIVLGPDYGFCHSGPRRASSLYRSLFDPDEVKALAQEAQRSTELFAHVYPRLMCRNHFFSAADADELRKEWERHDRAALLIEQLDFSTQILDLYMRRDCLDTRLLLEAEYRRSLAIPKVLYDKLRDLFCLVDRGYASEAVDRLLDEWEDGHGPANRWAERLRHSGGGQVVTRNLSSSLRRVVSNLRGR
jgi:hypothetical protein